MDPAALDLLPEAVVVSDRDGVVLHVNVRAGPLLGLGAEAVGRPLRTVLSLVDDSGGACELPPRRPVVGTRLAERIVHVRRPDGSQHPVALAGRFDDDRQRWVLTARSAGRREALARVQGDVIATVAHEIRSPLSSVKGFTRTLLSRWDRFSDAQKRAMLATVDADADRVTRLLVDLLEVSRIDAGRVRLRREPVDLVALSRAVLDKARHRDEGSGRTLRLLAPDDVPKIRADADRIEQVVTNLVDNALRHAPEGPVEVRLSAVDGGVMISVADVGAGIDAQLEPRVFNKFAAARHGRRAGTGLGLYISRGLVRAHQGRIWLEQPASGGAIFHVWLPVS